MWFEEMINNRNKSVVRDMKWTADGQKICIVYEDGAVIVGSVDGNRLWGKELKHTLAFVEWSPDGRNIIFVTTTGEPYLYDNLGNKISKIPLYAVDDSPNNGVNIIGIHWYDGAEGHLDVKAPTLAIAFENGAVQVTRGEQDDNSVLIDTGMKLTQCKWNTNGSVLALAGSKLTNLQSGEERDVSMVQFYDPYGMHLRTLKVPGNGISALSWEGGGLRIALAVDSYIYFANIRPDYKWGYFGSTLVYSYNKPERPEHCVVFWDTKSDDKYVKYIKQLMSIHAAGENTVLVTQSEENESQHTLILCNAIGSPVDTKFIEMNPAQCAMTKYHVIVASEHSVYIWQYRTPVSKLTSVEFSTNQVKSLRRKEGRERIFHIDDAASVGASDLKSYRNMNKRTDDPICAITASETCLVVGRESGLVHRYTLPHISLETTYQLRARPQKLALNCNSSKMSTIDGNGMLNFFDFEAGESKAGKAKAGEQLQFERKDAWDMMWAEDNPEQMAMMEKTRMYIFEGLTADEPVLSSGYICEFKDLQVKAIMLDEIMQAPEQLEKEVVLEFESKSLRDVRELLGDVGIREAYQFIEDHPHPRLWRLLAEAALEELDLIVADKAFVRCADYQGIQYVKRLKLLDDKMKQKAEVAAYFQRFDEAESLYREIDRKDLAIELRMRLGDWFRVVQLVQSGGGDDELLTLSWNRIGDYYAARQKWGKAVQYYAQAKNSEALVDCYYILEDFKSLEKIMYSLADGSNLLKAIGERFQSVGISEAAVQAYIKAGDIKQAIDCCVLLHRWDKAVELAEEHQFPQIEGLLQKYANQLLEKGKIMAAVELYRKANKSPEAAKLLARLGQQMGQEKRNPLRAKKLHVLAALEVERFRKRVLDTNTTQAQGMTAAQTTAATLESLMTQDEATGEDKVLDRAWRGAEAYHFFLMAQRQLYLGHIEPAMKTSLRLQEYEDILDPKDIYSLIALTAFYNKHYNQCSKAFIRLESLQSISQEEREAFSNLALHIFTKNPPSDPSSRSFSCPKCGDNIKDFQSQCGGCGKKFQACIQTGRSMLEKRLYTCRTCRHQAFDHELRGVSNCPLCHTVLL
jgi:WD repeat-containing protein 35